MRFFSGSNWDVKKVFLAITMFLGVIFVGNSINNDVWFLLNSGRYVETYGIPHVEPFTVHENLHFVMQQWLFALMLWKIYAAWGLSGLIVFQWAAGAVLLYVFFKLNYLVSRGNFDLSAIMTCFIGILFCAGFVCQRPWVASHLIFMLEIFLLEYYSHKQSKWLFALFPLLSVLLINLHAAMWPMLFVFLLPYLAEMVIGGRIGFLGKCTVAWTWQKIILLAALMLAAAFVNPYGIEAMTYTYYSYGIVEINRYINEMAVVSIRTWIGLPIVSMFAVTAVYSRNKVPLHYILLSAGTALMSLLAIRSLFLYLLFGGLGVAYVYRNWKGLDIRLSNDVKSVRIRYGFMLALSFLSLVSLWQSREFFHKCVLGQYEGGIFVIAAVGLSMIVALAAFLGRKIISREGGAGMVIAITALVVAAMISFKSKVPDEVIMSRAWDDCVEILQQRGSSEELSVWTGYTEGGYLEFNGMRCYMDARAEVFIKQVNAQKDIFHEYMMLCNGRINYKEFMENYHFTHILVNNYEALYESLQDDDDYLLLYDSDEAGTTEESSEEGAEPLKYRLYEVKR